MSLNSISSLKHGKTHIVKLAPPNGVLLPSDLNDIDRHLEDLLLGDESPEFLLNFQEVQGFDGELVEILTRFRTNLRERGGKLAIVGVSQSLLSVFDMAGVASLFVFCADESQAVQAIATSGNADTIFRGKVDWVSEMRDNAAVIEIRTPRLNQYDLVNDLADGLEQFTAEINARHVIINFERVEFMTSSMLGRLVQFRNRLDDKGGKLVLVGLSESIRHVFDTTRLNKFFHFYSTVDQALEAI